MQCHTLDQEVLDDHDFDDDIDIPWIIEIEFLAIFYHGNQRHTS